MGIHDRSRIRGPKVRRKHSETESTTFTGEEAKQQAWSAIERYIMGLNPYEFQELVASLLHAMGNHIIWVAPPGKDGGVDIFASIDPLGLESPRIKVQVKRRADKVRLDELNAFLAILGEDDVGIFVAVSGFTRDARKRALFQEQRKVTLVDLRFFFDLWVQNYERLDEKARQMLPTCPIHVLALTK